MCMESRMILGDKEVVIRLGYKTRIAGNPNILHNNWDIVEKELLDSVRSELNKMTKEQLVDSIIMLIENSEEA